MEHPTKALLRMEARLSLSAITEDERAAASTRIRRAIAGLAEWQTAHTVGMYAAQTLEPDLMALLGVTGKTFCFPRVMEERMEFHRCNSADLLKEGRFGLLEPDTERCLPVRAKEIDLLLIPGLAFTRSGGRLGRGGGFYDRFLGTEQSGAVKIGVCFHPQLIESVPLEGHDHEVDFVVTEQEVVRCGE
jgi:5-formyltetrahydrofolate cyclo-ligase